MIGEISGDGDEGGKLSGSVGLYKVKGGGVCDFSFLNTGDQSEIPPRGGLQNDMPRMQQRSMKLEI